MQKSLFFALFFTSHLVFSFNFDIKKVSDIKAHNRRVLSFSYIEKNLTKSDSSPETHEFFLVKPTKTLKHEKYPLKVILHSSGFNANKTMLRGLQNKTEHEAALVDGFTLYIDGSRNRYRDNWWGWHFIETNSSEFKKKNHPVELRILDSVSWVQGNFPIDPNSVHLFGVSMGGSGALGVGLNRGDVFSTVSVVIPAGVSHGMYRISNPVGARVEAPPVFIYFSHLDPHEQHPEEIFNKMSASKMYFSAVWGTQGHEASLSTLEVSSLFDFQFTLKKNVSYPVFLNVESNSEYPGFNEAKKGAQFGFLNSQFRWKILEDSPKKFNARIWLEPMSSKYHPPEKQKATVEFRRVQSFKFIGSECTLRQSGKIFKTLLVKTAQDCLEKIEFSSTPIEINFSGK